MKSFEEWMKQRRRAGNIMACILALGVLAYPLESYLGIPVLVTLTVELILLLLFGIIQGAKCSKERKEEKAEMERRWAEEDAKLFSNASN